MAARFEDHPRAVAEAAALAERLRFDLTVDLGYRYPGAEDPGKSRELSELCWSLMDERYPDGSPHRRRRIARLEEELRVIDALGLAGFFILHRDLLELAREVAARGARDATRRGRCCRRGAGAGRRCPRSSATSPASRTSTRSPTTSSSGASSTRS